MGKGVSGAEKRRRLEQLFHETKEFYQLKELEKIASKQKGIVSNTVKDVLQELCDDNLVQRDKIGSSWYYWSFPSDVVASRRNKIEALQTEIETLKIKIDEIRESIKDKVLDDRTDTSERLDALSLLRDVESRNTEFRTKLEAFTESDPATWQEKEQVIKSTREAITRWTDNIFILESYCVNQLCADRTDIRAHFNISDDMLDD